MSGPIVRKYGFPNFEKIFGERELKHGAADEPATTPQSPTSPEPAKTSPDSEVTKPDPGSSSPANPG